MSKRRTGKKPSENLIPHTYNVEAEITRRAHELYEERGREDGYALDDWLRAEREITQGKSRVTAV